MATCKEACLSSWAKAANSSLQPRVEPYMVSFSLLGWRKLGSWEWVLSQRGGERWRHWVIRILPALLWLSAHNLPPFWWKLGFLLFKQWDVSYRYIKYITGSSNTPAEKHLNPGVQDQPGYTVRFCVKTCTQTHSRKPQTCYVNKAKTWTLGHLPRAGVTDI